MSKYLYIYKVSYMYLAVGWLLEAMTLTYSLSGCETVVEFKLHSDIETSVVSVTIDTPEMWDS